MYTITSKKTRGIVKQVPFKIAQVEAWDVGVRGNRRVTRAVVHCRDLGPGQSFIVNTDVRDLRQVAKLEAMSLIEVK